jgi:hypothetical protein
VRASIKEERQAEAQMFRGRLGPAPSPATPAPDQAPAGGARSTKQAAREAPARGLMRSLARMLAFGYGVVAGLFVWLFRMRR